jgi:hypothetical protein
MEMVGAAFTGAATPDKAGGLCALLNDGAGGLQGAPGTGYDARMEMKA